MTMVKIFVVGGVSYNTMIYIDEFPHPHPQTASNTSEMTAFALRTIWSDT